MNGCGPGYECQARNCPPPKVCSDKFRCVLPGRAAWRRSGCNFAPVVPDLPWDDSDPSEVKEEDYDSDETDVEDNVDVEEEDELKSLYVGDFNPCRPERKEDREAAREAVYRCPGCVGKEDVISREPIVNPVCLDQQCYEATSLRQWLEANPRAPLSGRPYTPTMLDEAMLSEEAPGGEMCFHQGSWVNLDDDGNETVDDDEMVTEVWKPEVAS